MVKNIFKNNNYKFIVALIILVVFSSFTFYFYKKLTTYDTDSASQITVGVADNNKEPTWIMKFAEENGYLKKYNLKIKTVSAGTNIGALLSSGDADVVINRSGSVLTQYLDDEDVVSLGMLQNYNSADYFVSRYPRDKFSSIKSVGVTRTGGAFHISMVQILNGLGIDSDKVKVISAGSTPAARLAMFEKGKIDALVLNKTDLAKLDLSKYTVLNPAETYKGVYSPIGMYANTKTVESKKTVLDRYVKAMYEATNYMEKNEDKSVSSLAEYFKISKADAKIVYDNLIASRKNLIYSPKANDLKSLKEVVVKITKPSNSKRDLNKFVFPDFAAKAQR